MDFKKFKENTVGLHRADEFAEWENVPEEDRNFPQRIAAKYGSIATPGNLITTVGATATGFGLAMVGSSDPRINLKGIGLIGFGRIMDIADGQVASWTGTKSRFGEHLDAGVDTALMIAGIATLTSDRILPLSQSIALTAVTAAKMAYTFKAKKNKNEIHVTRHGKNGVLSLWGAIGSYTISRHFELINQPDKAHLFQYAGFVTLATGIALSAIAANDYRKYANANKQKP